MQKVKLEIEQLDDAVYKGICFQYGMNVTMASPELLVEQLQKHIEYKDKDYSDMGISDLGSGIDFSGDWVEISLFERRFGFVKIAITGFNKACVDLRKVLFTEVTPIFIKEELNNFMRPDHVVLGHSEKFRIVKTGEKIPFYEATVHSKEDGTHTIDFKEVQSLNGK